MKKWFSVLLAAVLCLALLAGCAPGLPEGVNEADIKQKAQTAVDTLHARDYDALILQFKPVYQDKTTPESWAAVFDPLLDQMGPFESYPSIEAGGQKNNDGTENAVVVVKAQYQNGAKSYGLYFDEDSDLVGIYIVA